MPKKVKFRKMSKEMKQAPNESKGLIPKLRFPEFATEKQWIFELLSEAYTFKITNSFSRDKLNYEKGVVKNIHYGDIHTKFPTLFDITKEIVPYINSETSIKNIAPESYCEIGDIIFADASEDVDDVGKSIEIINLNNEKLLSGLHTFLARQIKPKLIIGFGGYLFKSNNIRTQIKREAQGAKVLGISKGRISNIKIYYPENKTEQQKIASCLSSLDELLAAHNQKLDALKDHKKGLMQNLFPTDSITNEQLRITGDSITNEQLRITGEDDPCVIRNFETRNLPKVRFPEFEGDGEWVEKKLGEIAENLDSHRVPITSNIREKGKIPYYGASGIIDYVKDYIFDEHLLLISEDGANLIARVYPIAFSISGKTWINNHAHVLKFKNWFTQVLVEKYLNSKNIEDFLTGMAQPKLNRGKLDIIPIPLPNNSNEQQKIASCLSALDEIITAQTEKIEQLQQHKKGLMQGLFPNSIKNYESSITKKNRNS